MSAECPLRHSVSPKTEDHSIQFVLILGSVALHTSTQTICQIWTKSDRTCPVHRYATCQRPWQIYCVSEGAVAHRSWYRPTQLPDFFSPRRIDFFCQSETHFGAKRSFFIREKCNAKCQRPWELWSVSQGMVSHRRPYVHLSFPAFF